MFSTIPDTHACYNSTVIAHAGDGNFHSVVLFDPNKEEQRKEAERLNRFMVHAALDMDGTRLNSSHWVIICKQIYILDILFVLKLIQSFALTIRNLHRGAWCWHRKNEGTVLDTKTYHFLSPYNSCNRPP